MGAVPIYSSQFIRRGVVQREGQHRCGDQEQDERARDLPKEQRRCIGAFALAEHVRPGASETFGGGVRRETTGRRLQSGQHVRSRHAP